MPFFLHVVHLHVREIVYKLQVCFARSTQIMSTLSNLESSVTLLLVYIFAALRFLKIRSCNTVNKIVNKILMYLAYDLYLLSKFTL